MLITNSYEFLTLDQGGSRSNQYWSERPYASNGMEEFPRSCRLCGQSQSEASLSDLGSEVGVETGRCILLERRHLNRETMEGDVQNCSYIPRYHTPSWCPQANLPSHDRQGKWQDSNIVLGISTQTSLHPSSFYIRALLTLPQSSRASFLAGPTSIHSSVSRTFWKRINILLQICRRYCIYTLRPSQGY